LSQSVADSNHLYKKLPQYYKKKPQEATECVRLRKGKEQKKSKFMPDKPRSRIKKENEKKPQLSQK